MHVSVDPDRRSRFIGIAADGENWNRPAFGAVADGADTRNVGVLCRPGRELLSQLGVIEICAAEYRCPVDRRNEARIIAFAPRANNCTILPS